MISRFCLLIAFLCFSFTSLAQVSFSDRNDLLGGGDMHSGVPVAIADMNGDGLDDIVTLNEGTRLSVQYQTPNPDRPFVRYDPPVVLDIEAQNNIAIADFNNDGANDILTIGSYDRVKVLYGVPFTYKFDLTHVMVIPFFSQGASSGDFNGDGWVDVVILNDNGLNYTLINDGTGILMHQEFFDFATEPPSDNSGNYGSVYTDFDMDGDTDFYIAKCRQGVNSPNDPRRINVLLVNDGDNNYIEDAANYGLASGQQTWTTEFGDIDNDGDMDAFMTQHDVISELFENIDNDTFINITADAGLIIAGIPLQGMFRDFDNDGFQDILVSGDRVEYFHNNGDLTFTRENPFGSVVFGTFALGDLDTDGFTDIYASRVIPFNTPDLFREDILFLNEGNDNHFLSLKLQDTVGNTKAIGAMAILYGAWGAQVREVRGGEQYGVSNSPTMIFGLGQENSYDSLVIRWPDGTQEFYNNLAIDQSWTLSRGGCFSTSQTLWPDLEIICDADSVIIKVTDTGGIVQWNTGSAADSIIIKAAGLYFATFKNENNCFVRTLPVEVIKDPDSIRPAITYEGKLQLCNGDTVILSLPDGLGYQWSSGQTQQAIAVTESGEYFAELHGYCKVQISDTVSLDFLAPDSPLTQADTFMAGESAVLTATGDSIVWYDSSGVDIIGYGSVLALDSLTKSTTVFAQNLLPIEGQEYHLGPVQQQGNTKYNAAFVNGGLLFTVSEPIMLEEFTVFTDSAGTRIIVFSNDSDFLYEYQIDLDSGATVIPLDLELPTGAYTVSTDADLNYLLFGVASPYLWRSSEGILYPYEIDGVISITNSTFGEDFYYYFYDWKISTLDHYCGSDLVAVTALLDTVVAVHDAYEDDDLIISPNPSDGLTNVLINSDAPAALEIMNMNGKLLVGPHFPKGYHTYTLDLTFLPSGIYFIRLTYATHIVTQKVVKL